MASSCELYIRCLTLTSGSFESQRAVAGEASTDFRAKTTMTARVGPTGIFF